MMMIMMIIMMMSMMIMVMNIMMLVSKVISCIRNVVGAKYIETGCSQMMILIKNAHSTDANDQMSQNVLQYWLRYNSGGGG